MARYIDKDKLNLDAEVEMADDWKTAHEIANVIKYAPIEDVAPIVHAKWVKDKTNQLYCSACGQYGIYSEMVGTLHTFYCPYCGAKMEE